jgi:hypothetical protein
MGCAPSGLELAADPEDTPDQGPTDCTSSELETYYPDDDGDGYGDPAEPMEACTQPTGYVANADDCDPLEPRAYTGALEMCGDQVDNDCTGGDPCMAALVSRWSLMLGGTVVTDESGNLLDGILQGGLVATANAPLTFDGQDDYVEVPGDSDLFQLSAGTISFWFNASAIGQRMAMVSKDSNGRDQGGHVTVYLRADGTIQGRIQSNNEDYNLTSLLPVTANTWHHVDFEFGGNEGVRLYVDGALVDSDPYTGGMILNREPLVIGAGTDNSGDLTATPINQPFSGQLAEVQIHNRQLLIDELSTLKQATDPAL